jgi:putative cell wall-binding protein
MKKGRICVSILLSLTMALLLLVPSGIQKRASAAPTTQIGTDMFVYLNQTPTVQYGYLQAHYATQAAAIVPRLSLDDVNPGTHGYPGYDSNGNTIDDKGAVNNTEYYGNPSESSYFTKCVSTPYANYFWPLSVIEFDSLNYNSDWLGDTTSIGGCFSNVKTYWSRTGIWRANYADSGVLGAGTPSHAELTSNYVRPTTYLDLSHLSTSGLDAASIATLRAITAASAKSTFALKVDPGQNDAGESPLTPTNAPKITLGGLSWYVIGAYGWGIGQQSIGNMKAPAGTVIGKDPGAQGSAAGYVANTATLIQATYEATFDGPGSQFFSEASKTIDDTYPNPIHKLTVPVIGGGITTVSAKTPAPVVMGGPGSTYSTANDGQGVQLALTTPTITSDGGATITSKGWLISKTAAKPAASTLTASGYSSAWQPFNPSTYMSLADNGKYLAYYARNFLGYGWSSEVKVTVNDDYPYPEVGGKDRLATSATTALDAWPSGVSKAVFVSGAEFYDAECANYLAGALDCPILQVSPTASLNSAVKSTVVKLGIKSAYVVGGNCTATMMKTVGFNHYARVSSGKDGATDAVQVLQYVLSHKLQSKPTSLMLSTTSNFPDALGASAYIANKKLDMPVLFVNGLNDASKAAAEVKSLGSIKALYVLGSAKVVSGAAALKVKAACAKGSMVARLWGTDRNQTAASVFSVFAPKVASLNASKHLDAVGIAAGSSYPDALGAGAAQAHLGGAVYITPATKVGPWLSRILGGGSITVVGSKQHFSDHSIVKTLINFEFYGQGISLKVRDSISKYVR